MLGNTHEDIDGIYGVLHQHLITVSYNTKEEFEGHLRYALRNHPLPVFINWVTGTLNFDEWSAPSRDPNLRNFARHDHAWNPGMHLLR